MYRGPQSAGKLEMRSKCDLKKKMFCFYQKVFLFLPKSLFRPKRVPFFAITILVHLYLMFHVKQHVQLMSRCCDSEKAKKPSSRRSSRQRSLQNRLLCNALCNMKPKSRVLIAFSSILISI